MIIKRIKDKISNKRLIKRINKKTKSHFSFSTCLNGSIVGGLNFSQENVNLKNSKIGYGTYFGTNVRLTNCLIGNYSSIGSNVSCVEQSHSLEFISTYPVIYRSSKHLPTNFLENSLADPYLKTLNGFDCEIGNDVWIGNNVLIKGGISIGDGAVVGMGAVVTKNVPPYAIVAGNPATIIRFRFDKNTIKKLQSTNWWTNDVKWVEKNHQTMLDVSSFLEKNQNN